MQYRSISLKHNLIFFGITLGALWLIAFVASGLNDQQADAEHESLDSTITIAITRKVEIAVKKAVVGTLALEGFILSRFTRIPNVSLQAGQRVEVFPDIFDNVAAGNESTPMSGFVVLSSGAVSQVYPPVMTHQYPLGNDLYHQSPASFALEVSSNATSLVSPVLLYGSTWGIAVRIPIHNGTDELSLSTWWGTVIGFLSFELLVAAMRRGGSGGFVSSESSLLLLEAWDSVNQSWFTILDERRFVDMTHHYEEIVVELPLSPRSQWRIVLFMKDPPLLLLRGGMGALIGLMPLVVAAVIVGAANILFAYATRVYTGIDHAPKQAPMAHVSIGIAQGNELWMLQPDVMVAAHQQLQQRLTHVIRSHRGYQTRVFADHSYCVVTRSIDAAVHLSFSLIESLESDPILLNLQPKPTAQRSANASGLQQFTFGASTTVGSRAALIPDLSLNAGSISTQSSRRNASVDSRDNSLAVATPLHVVCSIHWCFDVAVDFDIVAHEYGYEGKSILFASKLFAAAVSRSNGSDVWLSQEAVKMASHMKDVRFERKGEIQLPRTLLPVTVFVATDPDSELMKRAVEGAQRSREAVQRFQASGAARRLSTARAHTEMPRSKPLPTPDVTLSHLPPADSFLHTTHNTSGHLVPPSVDGRLSADNRSLDAPLVFLNPSDCGDGAVGSSAARRTAGNDRDASIHSANRSNSVLPTQAPPQIGQAPLPSCEFTFPEVPEQEKLDFAQAFEAVSEAYGQHEYSELLQLFHHFLCCYSTLFKPFSASERETIFRRLATAFGLAQRNFLVNLSVSAALVHLSSKSGGAMEPLTMDDFDREAQPFEFSANDVVDPYTTAAALAKQGRSARDSSNPSSEGLDANSIMI